MSVDLLIDSVRPIAVKPLLPKVAAVLADMLGVTTLPPLLIERLENGSRLPVVSDLVGIDQAPFLLLSISGEPESIGISSSADRLDITIFGQRSSAQYALGAATAITLARELEAGIWDDRKFFGNEIHTSPETLLRRLRVTEPHHDYREAAERISWGPAGGP